jgi:hypothetical protein
MVEVGEEELWDYQTQVRPFYIRREYLGMFVISSDAVCLVLFVLFACVVFVVFRFPHE